MPAPKNVKTETPGQTPDTPATLKAKDEALQAQLVKTAKLVGDESAMDWSHLNQAAAARGDQKPEAELPDESEVDPDELTSPKLTRQGWVMPTNDPRVRQTEPR